MLVVGHGISLKHPFFQISLQPSPIIVDVPPLLLGSPLPLIQFKIY